MEAEDDAAYRRSVRNMSLVLAAIVITVFAALFVPPYLFPAHNAFPSSVTFDSPVGFTLHLTVNATQATPGQSIMLTGWLNSTSSGPAQVNASDQWALPQGRLWTKACLSGWPIGLGLMKGHYTQDNYSEGSLIALPAPPAYCPSAQAPASFLLYPHSWKALVTLGGTPTFWVLQSNLSVRGAAGPQGQQPEVDWLMPGVYTAVLADGWGDVLTINFQIA